MRTPLRHVAHVRSGDKGNSSTLSVIAYDDALYPLLVEQVTEARVAERYGAAVTGPVRRYAIPAIGALNFVLEGALGGGVSRSLAIDVYGKALCSAVLDLEIEVPDELADRLVGQPAAIDVVGSWELVRYTRTQGSETIYPFGKDAVGWLQYGAEGRVSATLSRRTRTPLTTLPDAYWRADPREWAEAAMSYVAYTGTWSIDGDKVEHRVESALFPNWTGMTLTRWASFVDEGGERLLKLTTPPFNALVSELVWRRWRRD
ncbi:lipocalin-like domain-containing protein [Sphingoaurantiacus capsulatus]|uniref:Lipocalin-like domain-containing protein n=1 Tax=Sphingoaurantiacus capsulatus TaxID=1771310 RepID=A0ABV7X4T0_9SPHN